MFKPNVKLGRPVPVSSWRKISFGSWRPTGDSAVYSSLHLPVEKVKAYLQDNDISMHLFLIKTLARAVEINPKINRIIRFGKLYPRQEVDIFYHVVTNFQDPEDLSGVVVRSPQKKRWEELKSEFSSKTSAIKRGEDQSFTRIKKLFGLAPGIFSRFLLNLSSFVMYTLNLWSPLLGAPRDSFGGVMLTNIGSFGADHAYCPIAPYTRIPMVVAAGKVAKRPFVEGDQVVAKETIILSFTFDHRIVDGVQTQRLGNSIKEVFERPELLDS